MSEFERVYKLLPNGEWGWATEVADGGGEGGTGLPPQWTVDDATGKVTGDSTDGEATLTINASPDGDRDALRVNYDNDTIALQIGEDTGFQARGRNGLDNVDNNGGEIGISGGDAAEDGNGGGLSLFAGTGGFSGAGGPGGIAALRAGAGGTSGGDVFVVAGAGASSDGGNVTVESGGSPLANAGILAINGGNADVGDGGSVIIAGGAGADEGGEIRLTPGSGLITPGRVSIRDSGGDEQIAVTDLGKIAFFGAAGVDQPVVPLTAPSVQDVIDALVALGLVSQSD